MALAILKFQDQGDTHCRFEIDLGVNRFYSYSIGSGKSKSSTGLPQLNQTTFTSSLLGPLPDRSLGRTILEVPNQQFDRHNRFIQLFSFRTAEKTGAAISEIVEISRISTPLPAAMSFSPVIAMNSRSVETVPFCYQETQPVSSAMFLDSLMKVIKSVAQPLLKVAAPIVKAAAPIVAGIANTVLPGSGVAVGVVNSLVGSGAIDSLLSLLEDDTAKTGDGAAKGNAALQTLLAEPTKLQDLLTHPQVIQKLGVKPETAQLFATLLQKLLASAAPPADAPATSEAQALGSGMLTPRSPYSLLSPSGNRLAQANGLVTLNRPLVSTVSVPPAYAEEMAVPATLTTVLPELIALLEKVFPPETLKMLVQPMPPQQALGIITQGLIDISNSFPNGAGAQASRSIAQALSQPDRTANNLAQGLSVGLSASTQALKFQRVESVQLKFTDTTTLMMNGRSRLLYRYDRAITLPMTVETPRPITKGIVQLVVKHPQTLEVLIEEKYRLENITTGALAVVPTLSPERLRSLFPNQDYLVCVSLLWQATCSKTQKKKRIGTSLSQLITLVCEYSFDRIEGTPEVVPLNDVDRFRDYWHNVWEKSFAFPVQQMSLDCKYYLTLEPERTNHARMETLTKFEDNIPTRLEGKLKTGLLMSPYRLNELLPQISSYPSLNPAELAALMTPEFKQQCSYVARSAVEFQGTRGDKVGLWAYPEMKVQRLLLKQAGQTNANGQVLALTEREVYFPIPAVIHFIGVGN